MAYRGWVGGAGVGASVLELPQDPSSRFREKFCNIHWGIHWYATESILFLYNFFYDNVVWKKHWIRLLDIMFQDEVSIWNTMAWSGLKCSGHLIYADIRYRSLLIIFCIKVNFKAICINRQTLPFSRLSSLFRISSGEKNWKLIQYMTGIIHLR